MSQLVLGSAPVVVKPTDLRTAYVEAVYGRHAVLPRHGSTFAANVRKYVTRKVFDRLHRQGDSSDGMGDKTESMDMFEYWLQRLHVYTNLMSAAPQDWNGKVVCFAGKVPSMKMAEAEQLVKDAGGAVSKSLTKKTTHLVTSGNFDHPKVRDAAKMDIPMVVGDDFVASVQPLGPQAKRQKV